MQRKGNKIMSVFTDNELAYLLGQRLGRLATIRPDGTPQITPVGFLYHAELDVIDIGGQFLSRTKKFRNIQIRPHVSLVIDDVLPPWQPRGVEVRGTAQAVLTGGKALFGSRVAYEVDDVMIRITPHHIVGWGLDPEAGWSLNRTVDHP
jgi:pyridoxamine 5'-phosphate oxidase family protein